MPEDDLTLQMPGDEGAASAATPATSRRQAAAATPIPPIETNPDASARIAQLEQELAQARAMNEQLMDAQGAETAAAPPAAKEVKMIGEDWSTMTSTQAKEAGVTKTVLCSDGYYVP